jgi:hypothetical protein
VNEWVGRCAIPTVSLGAVARIAIGGSPSFAIQPVTSAVRF